jgi:hypothetical protein
MAASAAVPATASTATHRASAGRAARTRFHRLTTTLAADEKSLRGRAVELFRSRSPGNLRGAVRWLGSPEGRGWADIDDDGRVSFRRGKPAVPAAAAARSITTARVPDRGRMTREIGVTRAGA